ncbi:MAG: RNA polymerase sigma factor [Candidatus Aminicenantes bacterium]|nr:RNA polymerase sigma factor [Candidatus Aminicenantes bacterium]
MQDAEAENQFLTEQQCIDLVKKGDKEAYSTVVKKYMKKAYYIALGFVKTEPDALDVSQEAFIKAFRHIKKFKAGNDFFPWFYKILKNLCLDWLKKNKNVNLIPLENISLSNVSQPNEDIKIHLWKEMEKLSIDQKEILLLRYLQGFTYLEIAQILDKPLGSVMSSLHYAKKNLRKKMERFLK